MTITAVRSVPVAVSERGDWLFVEVETDSGLVGTGEASQSGDDRAAVAALHEIGPQLIGRDPTHIDQLMATPALSDRDRGARTAASAIEQALSDIHAASLGVPLCGLLGGGRDGRVSVPLHANINRATTDRSATDFAALAVRAVAEGFPGVEDARAPLVADAVDVQMPDVKHCGGIGELRAMAAAARMCGTLVAPHNPTGPVATLATAHAVTGVENFQILEYAYGEVPWRAELLDPPELIRDGEVLLGALPGLGHRLAADVVSGHRR